MSKSGLESQSLRLYKHHLTHTPIKHIPSLSYRTMQLMLKVLRDHYRVPLSVKLTADRELLAQELVFWLKAARVDLKEPS